MCTLRAHINKSSFGKILLGIEKIVKIFSIFNKFFPKLIYYCVYLRHTLIKSFINSTVFYFHSFFYLRFKIVTLNVSHSHQLYEVQYLLQLFSIYLITQNKRKELKKKKKKEEQVYVVWSASTNKAQNQEFHNSWPQ